VVSICQARPRNFDDFIATTTGVIMKNGWAAHGDRLLFVLPQDILNIQTPLALVLRTL